MSSIRITSLTDVARRRMKELWAMEFEGSRKDYLMGKLFAEIEYDEDHGTIVVGPTKKGVSKYAARRFWNNDILLGKIQEQLRTAFVSNGLLYNKDFTIEVLQ